MRQSHPLPDVRDGLSLVHRRVLLAMRDAGAVPGRPYKKSVGIVRDVFKRFRPRARDSAYDALVAMVQDFTFRYPLIEGHGNFGSIEGDPPASPSYTEVGLTPLAAALLTDTDPAIGSTETGVLGAAIPNLIINGSANCPPNQVTSIPPHNVREVVRAAVFLIDHPDANAGDLHSLIPAPDFPTGATILGYDGIKDYQATGRGRLTVRARTELERDDAAHRWRIVVTELPYGVEVAPLVEAIACEVRDQRIDTISDLRNESSRDGMRIVIVLKREVSPEPVLRQLYERTALETTLDVNMTALVPQPETGALVPSVVTLKELLEQFVAHRHAVIARREGADLYSKERRIESIKDDLLRIADVYGDKRRTEIGGER
jgi:DNA gyrase subunit A